MKIYPINSDLSDNYFTIDQIDGRIGGIKSGYKWQFGKAKVTFSNNTQATDITTIPAMLKAANASSVYSFVATARSLSNLQINLDTNNVITAVSLGNITGTVYIDFIVIVI